MSFFERSSISPSGKSIFEKPQVIQALHEKMMKRRSYYQPNPEDFIHETGYSESEIREELARVARFKENWSKSTTPESARQKQISDIIETIIVDQFSGPWLSEHAEGYYTSEVDDVLRGVDVVAEIKGESESRYLGFAIDVTMAKQVGIVDRKLSRNWEDVQTGHFPEIKYFENDDGERRRLQPLRVLIAVDPAVAQKLMEAEYENNKEELARHSFQADLILQVQEQLGAYVRYAELVDDPVLLAKATESLELFEEAVSDKEDLLRREFARVGRDTNFMRIRDFCENYLKQAKAAA